MSILFTIILFQIFPGQKRKEKIKDKFTIPIEVLDIPLITEEPPPPPPTPPVVEETITTYEVVIEEDEPDPRKIREELEDVKLEMDLTDNSNLLAESQMGDITYASSNRSKFQNQSSVSLDIGSNLNRLGRIQSASMELDLNESTTRTRTTDNTIKLENSSLLETSQAIKKTENDNGGKKTDEKLLTLNENQFLLRESESTIGTNEYRLWNKINAVLDRLDKNRFGKLPDNVRRTTKGLNVAFNFNDGIQHDVYWSKGGKVVIRVTGKKPQQLSNELEKAYEALIQLTL